MNYYCYPLQDASNADESAAQGDEAEREALPQSDAEEAAMVEDDEEEEVINSI